MNTFKEKDVIDSYKLEDLLRTFKNSDKRCDFLPALNNGEGHRVILSKWKDYFSKKHIPWAVTMKDNGYGPTPVLWKINEGLTQQEIRDITNKGVYKL